MNNDEEYIRKWRWLLDLPLSNPKPRQVNYELSDIQQICNDNFDSVYLALAVNQRRDSSWEIEEVLLVPTKQGAIFKTLDEIENYFKEYLKKTRVNPYLIINPEKSERAIVKMAKEALKLFTGKKKNKPMEKLEQYKIWFLASTAGISRDRLNQMWNDLKNVLQKPDISCWDRLLEKDPEKPRVRLTGKEIANIELIWGNKVDADTIDRKIRSYKHGAKKQTERFEASSR